MFSLHIEGPIGGDGGITAAKIREQLKQANGGPVQLLVNSPGGSVFTGYAVADELKRYGGAIDARITGLAASIASFIVMAADRITVTDASVMMLHDPAALTLGNAADHAKSKDMLDALADQLARAYARRMNIDASEARELMRSETWYYGSQIVEVGLADIYEESGGEHVSREDAAAQVSGAFSASAADPGYWKVAAALLDDGQDLTPEDKEAARLAGMTFAEYREYSGQITSTLHDPSASAKERFITIGGKK